MSVGILYTLPSVSRHAWHNPRRCFPAVMFDRARCGSGSGRPFRQFASEYASNPEAAGNALSHLAVFYHQTGKKILALETVDEAEMDFRKSLKENRAAFNAIEQLRQSAGPPSAQQ